MILLEAQALNLAPTQSPSFKLGTSKPKL